MCPKRKQTGLTLIEVVIFIVVIAIGFTATFVVYNTVTQASVDPLVRKQALAIATSLMEEIQVRAFTYCDPDDANVYTAQSATVGANGCASIVEALGLESGESYTVRSSLDNVNDYAGIPTMSGAGITDITGTPISASGLNDYSVSISVANIAANELPLVTDVNDALKITVTATGPTGVSVSLVGYRLRYAPNSP